MVIVMKKNNGFTLTELLAVIAILGIIITIAATNIATHMAKSRKKTELVAAKNYITAINDYNLMSKPNEKFCKLENSSHNLVTPTVSLLNEKLKDAISGKPPKSGTVNINCSTYKVTSANLKINRYTVQYDLNPTGNNAQYRIVD